MPYMGLPDRYGDYGTSGRVDRREVFAFGRVKPPVIPEPPVVHNPNTNEKVWSPPRRPLSCKGVRRNGAPASQSHMGTFSPYPPHVADPYHLKLEKERDLAKAQRALRPSTAFKPSTNDLDYRLSKNAAGASLHAGAIPIDHLPRRRWAAKDLQFTLAAASKRNDADDTSSMIRHHHETEKAPVVEKSRRMP